MAAPKAKTVSLTEIAGIFGVTTEAIRLWRKEGMPTRRDSGRLSFVIAECVRWRRQRDQEAAKDDDASDTTKADKRAILRSERQLRELEVRQKLGEMVERATFEEEIERFAGGLVAAVTGRLQQFERDIVQASTPAAARVLTERMQDELIGGMRAYADALDASADEEDDGEFDAAEVPAA